MTDVPLASPTRAQAAAPVRAGRTRLGSIAAYCQRNPQLVVGVTLLLFLVLVSILGHFFISVEDAQPMVAPIDLAPSSDHLLGTDDQGRDLLAVIVVGLPLTLRIGLLAGGVGLGLGICLGMLAGYRGGIVDVIIRMIVDTLLTVPSLLILLIIAASIKSFISVDIMALVVASLAWTHPTRTIRSQVLSLRERAYVQMAKLSGMNTFHIIIREIMPNLLPYLAASFVGAVASAILASIGLEALGLGPQNEPTIGMTIYWAIYFNALLRGLWWWWIPPIVVVVILFIGLYLMSAGLDEIANPRLRKAA
jgi:peptide/nickel transport system permease protein